MIVAISLLTVMYFVLWTLSRVVMAPAATMLIWRHQRRHSARSRALLDRLASPPLVTVVVPAFNEELTVVDSVRGLLAMDYEAREVVVVNDGSSDRTLEVLREAFQLVAAPIALAPHLQAMPVRNTYRSVIDPGLVVIDKGNGGSKSDAVNAGINAASGTLVLVMDADTVLAADAVSRAVLVFLENPETVAVGGNVAIVNGCRVKDGRIREVALPRSWLARFQVIEYLRSFLLVRLACASQNAVFLISGAFGMFRRDALVAVGGFDSSAVAEDLDLTIRLQRHFRERGLPFRIAFDPNPLGWTLAPEDLASLRSQRLRWRRGLLDVLWRQRRMIGNPRYGFFGLAVLPYLAFFEGLGVILEISGYSIVTSAALLGAVDWRHWSTMMAASVVCGTASTLLAVIINDLTTKRFTHIRDFVSLVTVVVVENLGYLQMNSWWGCVGTVEAIRGKTGWGTITRRTFS
jgi:cellulose synthase/poly-beta-1,6-N-acetylglucosamine synthase-like glycosyltransferase